MSWPDAIPLWPNAALLVAACAQLGVSSANFVAYRWFDYPGEAAKLSPFVREVFWVQQAFIVGVLVAASAACAVYPTELASGAGLGRGFAGFFSLFWGARLGVQLLAYDRELRQSNRPIDLLFVCTFVYLVAVYGLAAAGWRP